VLIGVSTGGPNALQRLFSALPANLGVPIVVVQHMPPLFTRTLAESLSGNTRHIVREALDGECLAANCVYIAPGGRQMGITRAPDGTKMVRITDDPPENNCKPSVDYLFRSVATAFPGQALAVILTGMGNDGSGGLRLLKVAGCKVLAQDESTCVVFGMPKAAIDSGLVDAVLPIDEIAPRVVRILRGVSL
jgi:two-component system, chemotaxis family, protein-glutamate methylesterase/glutaminase